LRRERGDVKTLLGASGEECRMAGSKAVVLAALFANGAIAVLKFGGFLLTGSPSMLSETYHSISDTGNQVFLLIGIRYSSRDPSRAHPFGYGKAQFFYSFLVSVLLFGIAGWESLKHGYNAVLHGSHAAAGPVSALGYAFPSWYVNVVILLGAIGFETYALVKANAELRRQIDEYGWSGLVEAFRKTSDVTTLTAFTEDAVALGGAAIALVGVVLSQVTGNHVYDAMGAVAIGVLLMGFALALAWENKRLILGESLPSGVESDLRSIVTGHPSVAHVDKFRTVFVGPQEVLVTADVSFGPDLDTDDIDVSIAEIERELRDADGRVGYVFVEPEL
jgi:cation diffusion facilitator family transporter